MAGVTNGDSQALCEYVRHHINSRLPKGIKLSHSEVTEVSIDGRRSRKCVVYGNATAIQAAWNDYKTLPATGLEIFTGRTSTYNGRTSREILLIYGGDMSYIALEGSSAIVVFIKPWPELP